MDTTSDTAADGDMYHGAIVVGSEGTSDNESKAGSDSDSSTSESAEEPDPLSNHPPRSYWQDNPPFPCLEEQSLAGTDVSVDVVIIGSGMTGVGVAKCLLELTASQGKAPVVVVIEARDICGGATGRNGGNITFAPHVLSSLYSELAEPEKVLEFHKNSFQALKELGEAYEPADMNMGVREVEMVDIFHESELETFNYLKGIVDILRRQHPQYEVTVLEENEVSELHANLSACGAITYKAGSFKPYHFVRGIWNDLVDKYPNLYISANNLVCDDIQFVASSSHPYLVLCSMKPLRARHVVHATGGHAPRYLPALNLSLTGGSMCMFAQRPSPGFPTCEKRRSWRLHVDDQLLDVIQLPDKDGESGDLMVGRQTAFLDDWDEGTQADEKVLTHLQQCMVKMFPLCGEGEVMLKSWSGIVGMTGDHLPFVGRIPPDYTNRMALTIGDTALYEASDADDGDDSGLVAPGEWISAGHGGMGMSSALLCGQALGIQIAGMGDEVLEKVAGRPGGKLNDWFPGKELSLDDDRLRRADLSSTFKLVYSTEPCGRQVVLDGVR